MEDLTPVPADPAGPRPPMEPQQAFLELGRLDFAALSLTEVLARVASLAKATVPGADEVSVTLMDGDAARTVAFTGELAVHLDERQYQRGFGPCMDAALSGDTIIIGDFTTDERYRDFGAVATRVGVHSSLSVGMPVPQRIVGGLNFYADDRDAFDESSAELAQAFAGYGAVAMVNAALVDSKITLAAQLERAMASRAVIEQAKGIIMSRQNCDADEAFSELVRRSQHTNRKLNLVAADIIAEIRASAGR